MTVNDFAGWYNMSELPTFEEIKTRIKRDDAHFMETCPDERQSPGPPILLHY
jgi:hypothetical protein